MSTVDSSGGRFDFDDGGSYAGDWMDGMANGHGVCTGPGGDAQFAGAWQMGFETSGVFHTDSSAAVYEGQWLQGRRHGLGVDSRGLPGASGDQQAGPRWLYRGEWTQGFRGRYGVRQSTATGTKYEGTWACGLQDGYGVETYADGGTYNGQWLRGVRHGYGVRQSVSYDMAVRFPVQSAFSCVNLSNPICHPEKEDDVLLRERDLRVEESRGGFVLRAQTTFSERDSTSGSHRRRMALDKHGRPSLRKTIISMMRQRSASDVRDSASSRSSSRMSGSVRSTSSHASYASSTGTSATGIGSVYSDLSSEASFVSEVGMTTTTPGLEIVERYSGEWKGDRRTGYGIAERSDGLRYEGEWVNNRKHGYGVTTLQDGVKIEGKYKNNILLASVSGTKSSKLFALRSGKIRDRVNAAVKSAYRAAEVARQKAEIAGARMLSARMKAEQAEEAARKAASDSATAKSIAQQYSPAESQPGSTIVANRPAAQENDLRAEFSYSDGFDGASTIQPIPQQSKFRSLFKFKKSSTSLQPTSADSAFNLPQLQPVATPPTHASLPPSRQNLPQAIAVSDAPAAHQNLIGVSPSTSTIADFTPSQIGDNRWLEQSNIINNPPQSMQQQQQHYQQLSSTIPRSLHHDQHQTLVVNGYTSSPLSAPHVGDGIQNGHQPIFDDDLHQPQCSFETTMTTQQRPVNNAVPPMGSYPAHNHNQHQSVPPQYSQSQLQQQKQPRGRSADDDWSVGQKRSTHERRKSLPSIVKKSTDLPIGGGSSAVQHALANVVTRRQSVETYVIDNGVRKRVRSIYDDELGPNPSEETVKAPQRTFTLESPRRADKGSVPDISQVPQEEILPREVVAVLSQQRREELIRQRAVDERRRRNQIVLCFGDIKDWCERRRMLMLLIIVNVSLASLFYSLLSE